jgi:UDP-GlcNAc:undecaprenyl-phosphate/decaprenyl-phosphate GlcNAc-1-phosphate transferase
LSVGGEVGYAAAFAVAAAVTICATPLVRRLAIRIGFLDHPVGYKEHARSTPYLGGVAVVAGLLIGAVVPGEELVHLAPLLAGALVLHAVGTLDDRRALPVAPRLAAQAAVAALLWATGWGWDVLGSGAANLALTIMWVLGVVNAFNLMDNIDGAASAVAVASAGGAATLALIHGEGGAAIAALAIAGACAGFVPHNLARPSRIFLGDGGSTPVGLVIAASIMAISNPTLGWATPVAFAPLVGLVLFDTVLVLVARQRRGTHLLRGDRNHLTHRLLRRTGSERTVALSLAALQAGLCGLVVVLNELDQFGALQAVAVAALVGLLVIGWLESPRPALLVRGRSA